MSLQNDIAGRGVPDHLAQNANGHTTNPSRSPCRTITRRPRVIRVNDKRSDACNQFRGALGTLGCHSIGSIRVVEAGKPLQIRTSTLAFFL